MKPIRFHADAQEELDQAAEWYESQRVGLGDEFVAVVRSAIAAIKANPDRWLRLTRRSRRYLLHRFPHAIVYLVREEEIVIEAIMHLSRRPGYWKARERGL